MEDGLFAVLALLIPCLCWHLSGVLVTVHAEVISLLNLFEVEEEGA